MPDMPDSRVHEPPAALDRAAENRATVRARIPEVIRRHPDDALAAMIIGATTILYGTGATDGEVLEPPDAMTYWDTASSLDGGPLFSNRPPLYPVFLQMARAGARVVGMSPPRAAALLQSFILLPVSLVILWLIARRLFRSRGLALTGLIVAAAYQPVWQFMRLILSEALGIPLALGVAWALVARRYLVAGVAAALLGITKTSSAGLSLAVAVVAAGAAWQATRNWRSGLSAGGLPILLAIGAQALWIGYGSLVIDRFSTEPAATGFSSYATAVYCGLELDAALSGAADAVAASHDYYVQFAALTERHGYDAVVSASRDALLDAPMQSTGCFAGRAARTLFEAPNYGSINVSKPAWFAGLEERLRVASVSLLPFICGIGCVGLAAGAVARRRGAAALLVVVAAQVGWLGVLAHGDLDLFRLRVPMDVVLLLGCVLLFDLVPRREQADVSEDTDGATATVSDEADGRDGGI